MQKILRKLWTLLKRLVIKIVSIEIYGDNLNKVNVIAPEIILTPEAPSMVFIDEAKFLQAETYTTPCAYTVLLEGVFYCPQYSVILTKERQILSESFNVAKPPEEFALKYLFSPKIEKVTGYSIIWHQTTNNYYHTLIDNLSRFYLTCQHHIIQQGTEIKLLHSRHISAVEEFYLSKFLQPNIKKHCVNNHKRDNNIAQLFYLEKLIISTFLNYNFSAALPSVCRQIFSRYYPSRLRARKHRIFISRAESYNNRNIINEAELLELLNKFGFKKYILEKMSVTEQIELFYDAEVVVAPHGAGLSNLVFSENVKVLELFPYPFVVPYFYYLAKSMGHTYDYWCGNCQYTPGKGWNNNFSVDISKIHELLQALV
jgi:hypothetical protein